MTDIRILQELDRELAHYSGAILVARSQEEAQQYQSCLSVAQRIHSVVKDVDATAEDEANYAITSVIARLQKVYGRKAVQPDPVACNNIRLAIRQLRRLIEPQEVDITPIDIFIV